MKVIIDGEEYIRKKDVEDLIFNLQGLVSRKGINKKVEKTRGCEHEWVLEQQEIIKGKVCFRTYRCRICGKEMLDKTEIQEDDTYNVTSWIRY